jgi:glycosyltransferase involved in cell wall biosynthesis
VAGDAALYFNPDDAGAIATAIEAVLSSDTEAKRLRTAGLERVRTFTWERTARGTLASYERAMRAR